jgi:hypothetical protein
MKGNSEDYDRLAFDQLRAARTLGRQRTACTTSNRLTPLHWLPISLAARLN